MPKSYTCVCATNLDSYRRLTERVVFAQKLVKDTFIAMAIEGYVTEPDLPPPPRPAPRPVPVAREHHSPKPKQIHEDFEPPIPTPMMPYPFKYENPNNQLPGGPSAKKGETTLKPWLTGKLGELKAITDSK